MLSKVVTQNGVSFITENLIFDAYARPVKVSVRSEVVQ